MVAYALEILVIRAYYATLDFRTPIGVGLVFVSINIAMTISMTPVLGLVAIPIALSVQKTLKVLVLCVILARRHPGRWLPTLVGRLLRITFCAVAFGLIYWRLQDGGATGDLRGFVANVLSVSVAAIPATAVYVVGLQIARIVDFRQIGILWDKILGRQETG
jgi:putative peptidoglycan lipid II flippase